MDDSIAGSPCGAHPTGELGSLLNHVKRMIGHMCYQGCICVYMHSQVVMVMLHSSG